MKELTQEGESVSETLARIEKSFRDIVEANPPDARVVVMTHGYFITMNASRAVKSRRRDFWRIGNPFWVANGSITKFTVDQNLNVRLKYFARRDHLK